VLPATVRRRLLAGAGYATPIMSSDKNSVSTASVAEYQPSKQAKKRIRYGDRRVNEQRAQPLADQHCNQGRHQ
jgi:hypothetical protein